MTEQSADETVYVLDEPVQYGSETITELRLIKPRAKHIRNFGTNQTVGDMLDLVGKLARQPKSFIDELSASDALKLSELVGSFLQGSARTGETA
jgi:hypothetical protein